MNRDNFASAMTILLAVEKGYVVDEGGETKFGISKRSYPDEDIPNLTIQRATDIYWNDYWMPCKCGKLPWPLSLYVFDSAVNQGQGTAKKMLQQALGVTVDGVIGNKTLFAAGRSSKWHAAKFMAIRCFKYTDTRNADNNELGWFTRLFEVTQKGERT